VLVFAAFIISLFLKLTKDRITYCPIPYAITEITINNLMLVPEIDESAPSRRRSEILSSAVSSINVAIITTAAIRIALLPIF
jgi:hypothetical protein